MLRFAHRGVMFRLLLLAEKDLVGNQTSTLVGTVFEECRFDCGSKRVLGAQFKGAERKVMC